MYEPPVRAASCPVTGMIPFRLSRTCLAVRRCRAQRPAGGVATRVRDRANSHSVRGGFPPPFRVGSDRNHMPNPNRRGPRALSEILGELFTVKGIRTTTGFGGTRRSLEHRSRRAALPSDACRRGAARSLDRDRGPSHAARRACRVSQVRAITGLASRRTSDPDSGHPVPGRSHRPAAPTRNRNTTVTIADNIATGPPARAREQVRATGPGGGRAPATMTDNRWQMRRCDDVR